MKMKSIFLAVVLCLCMSVTALAADDGTALIVDGVTYPVQTSNYGNIVDWVNADENRQVIIYTYGAATRMMLCETKLAIWSSDNDVIAAESTFVTGAKQHMYTFVDGEWVYNRTENMYKGGTIGSVTTVLASSRAFGNHSQHVRFRGALPVVILEVTGEQMEKTLPDLVGTMGSLAICGVSCLALLMALALLGRKSFLFRLR